jgi:hypothetical protein
MAIIDARQLRSLTLSESKGDKQTIQRSAAEEFLIIADTKDPPFGEILDDETPYVNLGNKRLPKVDDEITISGDITLVVSSRELSHYKDNERAVVMKVRYDGKPEGPGLPEPQGIEPTTWQRITIQTQQITKPALGWKEFNDIGGPGDPGQLPARNSAGDPVDGLEEESAMVRMTYTNTQVLAPRFEQLNRYTNTCNDGAFLGAAVYQVRMAGWNGEYDQKNNVWSISVEFLYKPDSWEIQYYDAGLNEIVGSDRKAILDKAGNPVGQPVPLDGNGGQLQVGDEPLTRYLYPYPTVNMAQLFADCGI